MTLKVLERILTLLVISFWLGIFLGAVWIGAERLVWYLDLPRVHRTMSTGECVHVDDPVHGYTCETVPVWPTVDVWVP